MKKPIIFSVFFFIITAIFSYGQGVWIEEREDPLDGLKIGKFEVNGKVYDIQLGGSNFYMANLRGANLSGANLVDSTFYRADLRGADLSGAKLIISDFKGADLGGANLSGADLRDADLSQANLSGADFSGADLARAKLNMSDLREADLRGADLSRAELREVNLRGVNLSGANLENTDLTGTDLRNVDFTDVIRPDPILDLKISKLEDQLAAVSAERDAAISERDAKIAELEQGGGGQSLEQVLDQVRDARAGSVVLTVDPEGDTVTLGLTIEQSDNLIEWTKLEGEITRTIPIPDGKKFYRFALDKGAQKEVHDPGHLDPPDDPPLEF